jgi:hypothetical protein
MRSYLVHCKLLVSRHAASSQQCVLLRSAYYVVSSAYYYAVRTASSAVRTTSSAVRTAYAEPSGIHEAGLDEAVPGADAATLLATPY